MKRLKFSAGLVAPVLSGQKSSTWRLFDEKNVSVGDEVVFLDASTGNAFATAEITRVTEKKMGALSEEDKAGHEPFSSDAEMYATYSSYYKRLVGPNTLVKIVRFRILKKFERD